MEAALHCPLRKVEHSAKDCYQGLKLVVTLKIIYKYITVKPNASRINKTQPSNKVVKDSYSSLQENTAYG